MLLFGGEGVGEDGLFAGAGGLRRIAPWTTRKKTSRGSDGARPQEQRGDGEAEDAAHVETLAPDAVGDPSADGEDYGVGYEIACQDPGGFVSAGGEGAGDVRHGDVDDGGVERLHEGGEEDGDGDYPGVGFGPCHVSWKVRVAAAKRWVLLTRYLPVLTALRVTVSRG